jgi:hypothetical protein
MDPSLNPEGATGTPQIKLRTAALSVVSNSALILLKAGGGIDHRIRGDPDRGGALQHRPGRLDGGLLLGAQGG